MAKKDYYQILGIEKNASADEVKRSFRRLAQQHHPDKGGEAEKFKEINEAYQILGDVEKRKQYDQFGTTFEGFAGHGFSWEDINRAWGGAGASGFGGFNGEGFDFQDLGDIVGDMFGLGSRRQRGPARGRDLEFEMTVDFEEAIFGVEETLNVRKKETCSSCSGSGGEPGTKMKTCPTCNGRGQVTQTQNILFGSFQTVRTCPDCLGSKQTPEKKCSHCHGTGATQVTKDIKVKIPAGIDNGQTIRLSGEGEAGERGAKSGDLYLTVRIKPHKELRREQFNILSTQYIGFPLASLGGKVAIKTLDGEVELKIPAATQSGQVFKLKGHGVPVLNGYGRGDHLVEIRVRTPEKLSSKASKLLKELEGELGQ